MTADIGPGTRDRNLERLATDRFDVCVIGGGITGAGIALEAGARGLSVALVERDDFAAGASSRSSKLVHGGLRYLAGLDLRLCRQAARERNALLRLAPHLVRPVRLLYPRFRGAGLPVGAIAAGLWAYDALGGSGGPGRHRRVSPWEAETLAPALRLDRVTAAWTFHEAQTDDARLVLAVLRQAHIRGAVVANHLRVAGTETFRGTMAAVEAVDDLTGDVLRVRARSFVNATGAWAEALAGRGEGAPQLRPSKGIHVVLPLARLPLAGACAFPAEDGREVFAIPRGSVIIVGTTDAPVGSTDPPSVERAEMRYLLEAVRGAFDTDVDEGHVVAAWAGLRPLLAGRGGRTADLSRRHCVQVSDAGLVTITGGKLTTFRPMARDAVDTASRLIGRFAGRSVTDRMSLGAPEPEMRWEFLRAADRAGLDRGTAAHLLVAHGTRAPEVLQLIEDDPSLGEPLVAGLEPLAAEAVWGVRGEMAVTMADVLGRRLGLALYDRSGGMASCAPSLIGRERGWSTLQARRELASYAGALARERGPVPVERRAGSPLAARRVPFVPMTAGVQTSRGGPRSASREGHEAASSSSR